MFRSLTEVLLPATCPGCGASAEPICAACIETLLPAPARATPPGLDQLGAALAYDGVARELVARIKYRNTRAAVAWLATVMVDQVPAGAVDIVTWAPTTPLHRRTRGFDHAELLARAGRDPGGAPGPRAPQPPARPTPDRRPPGRGGRPARGSGPGRGPVTAGSCSWTTS